VLSSQGQSYTTVQGTANSFTVHLDANVNAMVVTATSGFCAGSFAVAASGTVGSVGTQPINFNVATTDVDGKTIVGPGLPTISINGSSAASQMIDSNTISATITQSAQTFSLQATGGTANGSVTVSLAPPSGSDGLSYSKSLTFTFQSGAAPGSGFLALIEQTNSTPGHAAGQVDLLTLTGWPNPTGFSTYSPSMLTPTASGDVDNPQDMLFDNNGDLMIANGGAGSPDFGNFACIPAGAITAGASANATVITSTKLDDPASIAFGTDTSVGIASDAPYNGTTDDLDEFILSGTYAEAPVSRQVVDSSFSGLSALGVIALPTSAANPAGSYAVSIGNGVNPPLGSAENPNCCSDPAGSTSEVVIKHPDGSTATLNDSDNTLGLADIAYDPSTGYLITASGIASNATTSATGTTAYLDAWNVSSGSQTTPLWSYLMISAPGSPASSYFSPNRLAVSSTGYIAVAGGDQNGASFVQVYKDGAGGPTVQGAPIPFNGTDSTGATYRFNPSSGSYGYNMSVKSLKFLTSTKLLIGLQTYDGTWQGFYIYDVSSLTVPAGGSQPCNASNSTCYDQFGNVYGAGPTFVAFHQTTYHPLAAAFKP
jgi:hypothetical protein